jgi:hypothetical protein
LLNFFPFRKQWNFPGLVAHDLTDGLPGISPAQFAQIALPVKLLSEQVELAVIKRQVKSSLQQ